MKILSVSFIGGSVLVVLEREVLCLVLLDSSVDEVYCKNT